MKPVLRTLVHTAFVVGYLLGYFVGKQRGYDRAIVDLARAMPLGGCK